MKEIVLKPWEVEAFLAGRKSRITRVIKNQPPEEIPEDHNICRMPLFTKDGMKNLWYMDTYRQNHFKQIRWWECMEPYSKGDILYGKETWAGIQLPLDEKPEYWYKADTNNSAEKWWPSVQMPQEAARIFMRVTGVSVERLQDIGPLDIIAEGIKLKQIDDPEFDDDVYRNFAYQVQWDADHTKHLDLYGWNANPWVWVYGIERISNEEAYEKER